MPLPIIRHDGWTGEAMAKFLETLADTGIVLDACDAASKSSTAAYALRRREPLFAEAWEKALGIARDRLADTLLARSLEGNVERIIKDGEIVAEKHFIDNRLGLATLRRLDQRADAARRQLSSEPSRVEPEWELALNALRTGEAGDVAKALAMFKADEVCEVGDPPFGGDGDNFDHPRIWRDWKTEEWRTDYPPPAGFDGFEQGDWEDDDYCRALNEDELAALVAAGIAKADEAPTVISIDEDEAEREVYFSGLLKRHPRPVPGSTCLAPEEKMDAGSNPA